MDSLLWIAPLVLLGGLVTAHAGEPPPAAELEVTVEELAVASITDDTGETLEARRERLPPGGTLRFGYTDPNDGHDYDLEFHLRAVEPERPTDRRIALEYRWVDRSTGETREERTGITVEGAFTVSLYRLPEREIVLRLRPVVWTEDGA